MYVCKSCEGNNKNPGAKNRDSYIYCDDESRKRGKGEKAIRMYTMYVQTDPGRMRLYIYINGGKGKKKKKKRETRRIILADTEKRRI